MHRAFTANRISYFQPVPPPDGVFDIPQSCVGLMAMNQKVKEAHEPILQRFREY